MNIFPYGVINNIYNFNSNYPFLIVMLNTTKLYTFPNYRYEYIVSSNSNLFNFSDDFVQAIFFMFRKNNIYITDDSKVDSYLAQYIIEENKPIFVATGNLSNGNYLWKNYHGKKLLNVPELTSNEFYHSLPSLSELYENVNGITDYHYCIKDLKNKEFIIFGVWNNDIYYPCKITSKIFETDIPNKPYLLLKRDKNGSIILSSKNNSKYIIL